VKYPKEYTHACLVASFLDNHHSLPALTRTILDWTSCTQWFFIFSYFSFFLFWVVWLD